MSNCRRVERHFGDLDAHFRRDGGAKLLEGLHGSGIRVVGDAEKVEASLRSATLLYLKFRGAWALGRSSSDAPGPARRESSTAPTAEPRPPAVEGWPRWSEPDEDAVLRLAQIAAPYVRMLHPDIVRAVVDDNRRNAVRWSVGLRSRGVDPTTYLWDGCACSFPGVRRYAGSKEIAEFRGHRSTGATPPSGALRLDDNDFPKHLWSFVFRGRPFQKFGPQGYALAHLADHKDHGNRRDDEFDVTGSPRSQGPWFGLYTSAANSAYTPSSLLKPTDFASRLRNLLQRRALSLYGDFCALLPPGWTVRQASDSAWKLESFAWSEPVGSMANVSAFLEFRDRTMTSLLRGRAGHLGADGAPLP